MAESLKVNARERRFVEEYLVDHNGAAAISRAGFQGTRPDAAACKLLARPRVQELLKKRLDDKLRGAGIRADRVLMEYAAIAFSDARTLFDENGNLKPPSEWDDMAAASVAGIEVEELFEGRGEARERVGNLHKVKRWEKTAALNALAKYLRITPDRIEHSGPNGAPLPTTPAVIINFGFEMPDGGPGCAPSSEAPGPVPTPDD